MLFEMMGPIFQFNKFQIFSPSPLLTSGKWLILDNNIGKYLGVSYSWTPLFRTVRGSEKKKKKGSKYPEFEIANSKWLKGKFKGNKFKITGNSK